MMIKEESVLSVLMYLFKYHMQENCELDLLEQELLPKLEQAGFKKPTIIQALGWLSNLAQAVKESANEQSNIGFRVFNPYEEKLLSKECRGFILSLEQQGILNPLTRELVINQVLDLAAEGIDHSLIKWVTLMVLFNQPNEDKALACMEYLVLDEDLGEKH